MADDCRCAYLGDGEVLTCERCRERAERADLLAALEAIRLKTNATAEEDTQQAVNRVLFERDTAQGDRDRLLAGIVSVLDGIRLRKEQRGRSMVATVRIRLEKLVNGRTPKNVATLVHKLTVAETERDAAQARVRALAEAVERFEGIGHVAGCDRDIDEQECDAGAVACPHEHRACTCGWADVDAALDALAAPERGDG